MINNKVYRALKDIIGPFGIEIKKDSELHIVVDVIYWNGFPIPFEMQTVFYDWLINNPNFIDDTRSF